jgi:hypothetical protein
MHASKDSMWWVEEEIFWVCMATKQGQTVLGLIFPQDHNDHISWMKIQHHILSDHLYSRNWAEYKIKWIPRYLKYTNLTIRIILFFSHHRQEVVNKCIQPSHRLGYLYYIKLAILLVITIRCLISISIRMIQYTSLFLDGFYLIF